MHHMYNITNIHALNSFSDRDRFFPTILFGWMVAKYDGDRSLAATLSSLIVPNEDCEIIIPKNMIVDRFFPAALSSWIVPTYKMVTYSLQSHSLV